MNENKKILRDSLRFSRTLDNSRILDAVTEMFSRREQAKVGFSVSVVTERKLVVVCENPERVKEMILIDRCNPGRIYRRRLALKRKQNSPKA